jgi:hypothetical protein
MKIVSPDNTELAVITTGGPKGGPIEAGIETGGTEVAKAQVAIEKVGDSLVAHINAADGAMNVDMIVSKQDIKDMVPAMGKDAVSFMMSALLRR